MSPQAIEQAARILKSARVKGVLLKQLPDECRPQTIAEAYAIQDRLASLLEADIGGWFLGCTNVDMQRTLGLNEPYTARLFSHALRAAPTTLDIPDQLFPVVFELEFAFRLGRDLPPCAGGYDVQTVVEAIESIHPAVDVVIGHFQDWTNHDIASVVADNGTDGVLVYGAGVTDWQHIDLRTMLVTLTVNGKQVREGRGMNVLDGPLSAMVWLANDRSDRHPGLRAGHLIATGSSSSMYFAAPGDVAVADFGPLGCLRFDVAVSNDSTT